jgi:hypothetical protein
MLISCRYDARIGDLVDASKYTHPSLLDQLDTYLVRSFEFDVYDDREGGKFAYRGIRALLELPNVIDDSPEMAEPGAPICKIVLRGHKLTCTPLQRSALTRLCVRGVRDLSGTLVLFCVLFVFFCT